MWKHIDIRKDGVLPPDPMKKNVSLEGAPIVTLLGEVKGELGTRHHQLALASVTTSGEWNVYWRYESERGAHHFMCLEIPMEEWG